MKTVFTLFLCLFSFSLFAQDEVVYTNSAVNVFIHWGTATSDYPGSSFQNNSFQKTDFSKRSYSLGVAFEKVSDNIGFRFTTYFENIKDNERFESTNPPGSGFTSNNLFDLQVSQSNVELMPGIYRYISRGKWSFAAGLTVPFTIYGKSTIRFENESNFSFTDGNLTVEQQFFSEETRVRPEGLSMGIGTDLGFYFDLSKNLRLGMNYTPSVRYFVYSGETEVTFSNRSFVREEFEGQPPFISEEESGDTTTIDESNSELARFKQKFALTLGFSF